MQMGVYIVIANRPFASVLWDCYPSCVFVVNLYFQSAHNRRELLSDYKLTIRT